MSDGRSIHVVAAALVRDARVLAARRSAPHRLAGGWEFPGGKVEVGEDEAFALARECREELGVQIRVGTELAQTSGGGIRLVLFAATLTSGEPNPLEDHDELRWLGVDEVDSVPWLPIDRVLLPAVARHLREGNRRGRL
ncbi:MAG: (deoxy)nucleoside triphosphate pyrophosphohydrolase [Jatrophihabitans sp.]